MKNIKADFFYFLPIMILAFIVMLFYTRSSPLFFTNNWVDSNAYMTVGKGIVHGLTPYKDLFEQKGPLLYFLHALAYIIYPNTFFGIYIFESIAMAINMIIFYKIAKLFINKHFAYLLSFFLPVILLNSTYFFSGDSAEEFAIPCVMFLIYSVLSKINNHEFSFTKSTLFIHGALLAFVFWTKYSLSGAWIGFFLFYGLYLLWLKQFRTLLKTIMYSFAGFFVITLPMLVYFGINHAICDLYEVYFMFNLTVYAEPTSVFVKIKNGIKFIKWLLNERFISFLFVTGSIYLFLRNRKKGNYIVSICFLVIFFSTGFFQYMSGIWFLKYYFLIILPFATIGLICFAWALEKYFVFQIKHKQIIYLIAFLGAIILPYYHNSNFLYSRLFPKNSDLIIESPLNTNQNSIKSAQTEFAEIINKIPNATLLNYGYLDYGFFLAADIIPKVRYFMKINSYREGINDIQLAHEEYIKEKKIDFIVAAEKYYKPTWYLYENYRLVAVHLQTRDRIIMKYLLFQKNE